VVTNKYFHKKRHACGFCFIIIKVSIFRIKHKKSCGIFPKTLQVYVLVGCIEAAEMSFYRSVLPVSYYWRGGLLDYAPLLYNFLIILYGDSNSSSLLNFKLIKGNHFNNFGLLPLLFNNPICIPFPLSELFIKPICNP
jgi:hypothetical protein